MTDLSGGGGKSKIYERLKHGAIIKPDCSTCMCIYEEENER